MWIVSSLTVRPRTFSFAPSGQPPQDDLALVADGRELANMLRFVDWDDDPTQLLICEECGTIGCAEGNLVAVRRLEDFVLFAPSEEGHGPSAGGPPRRREPDWLRKHGIPLIPVTAWERLREEGAPLPPSGRLEPLGWAEALLAAQLEAPRRILGEPGAPPSRPLSARVAASDPWVEPGTLDRLGALDFWGRAASLAEARLVEGATPVSLVLAEDPRREVAPFAKVGGTFGLRFDPGLVLVPALGADR